MSTATARRGGVLSGLLLAALFILILIVAGVSYISQNVHVVTAHRNSADDVSIDTPAGHLNIRARDHLNPASLGIPIYPGAVRSKDGGGATFEWSSDDGKHDKGLSVAGGDLVTDDDADRVIDYYRKQLPGWLVVTEHNGATRIEHTGAGHKQIVVIRAKGDGTHIGVASVGEPASN